MKDSDNLREFQGLYVPCQRFETQSLYLPPDGDYTGEKESHEYEFWRRFFQVAAPGKVKEFHTRVENANRSTNKNRGLIKWDFWTGSTSKGYTFVLEKATETVDADGGRWKKDDWNDLKKLASKVVRLRSRQLKPGSWSYNHHIVVLNLWKTLVQRLKGAPNYDRVAEFVMIPGKPSAEYDFWVFFLSIDSPDKKEEFLKITDNQLGVVNWSFWTKTEAAKSYLHALLKLVQTIGDRTDDDPRWSKPNRISLQNLVDLVVSHRQSHLHVVNPEEKFEFDYICRRWEEIQEAAQGPVEWAGQEESSEYQFWLEFFRVASPTHLPEFKMKVENASHNQESKKGIDWKFWTGFSNSKSKSSRHALEKIIQTIDDNGGYWTENDWNELKRLAYLVVSVRDRDLVYRMIMKSYFFPHYDHLLKLWIHLIKILESGPNFKKIPEFISKPEEISREADLWSFFLSVHSPQIQEEFNSITTKKGVVNWSFWTGDDRRSYNSALDQLLVTLKDRNNDHRWTNEDWNLLQDLIYVSVDWTVKCRTLCGLLTESRREEFIKVREKWKEILKNVHRDLKVPGMEAEKSCFGNASFYGMIPLILAVGFGLAVSKSRMN